MGRKGTELCGGKASQHPGKTAICGAIERTCRRSDEVPMTSGILRLLRRGAFELLVDAGELDQRLACVEQQFANSKHSLIFRRSQGTGLRTAPLSCNQLVAVCWCTRIFTSCQRTGRYE